MENFTPQANTDPNYLASQELSETILERFLAKIRICPETGCWIWTGSVRWFKNGIDSHGQIWRGVRNKRGTWQGLIYAHVVSWILFRGPVPKGKNVLHKCGDKDNPMCVNPDHLYIGTPQQNSCDMVQRGNAFMKTGHKHFSGEANACSKLDWEKVHKIRIDYFLKRFSQNELARMYSITQPGVWMIIHHKNWPCECDVCRTHRTKIV